MYKLGNRRLASFIQIFISYLNSTGLSLHIFFIFSYKIQFLVFDIYLITLPLVIFKTIVNLVTSNSCFMMI